MQVWIFQYIHTKNSRKLNFNCFYNTQEKIQNVLIFFLQNAYTCNVNQVIYCYTFVFVFD